MCVQEIDPRAGGGRPITIGEMCVQLLTRLDWYTTLFPRIPVLIQKEIEANLQGWRDEKAAEKGVYQLLEYSVKCVACLQNNGLLFVQGKFV